MIVHDAKLTNVVTFEYVLRAVALSVAEWANSVVLLEMCGSDQGVVNGFSKKC